MKNDSFDDIVRKKVLDHEAPVPPGAWEAIAQKKKKRKRYPLFWWITGVSLVAGIASLFYIGQNGFKRDVTANERQNKQQPVNHSALPVYEKEFADKNDKAGSGTAVETVGATSKEQEKVSSVIEANPVMEKTGDRSLLSGPGKRSAVVTGLVRDSVIENDAATSSAVSTQPGKGETELLSNEYSYSRSKAKKNIAESPGNAEPVLVNNERFDVSLNNETYFLSHDYFQSVKMVEFSTVIKKIGMLPDTDSLLLSRIDSAKNEIVEMIASARKKSLKREKWTFDISVTPFLPLQQNQPVLYIIRTSAGNMEKSEYKTDKIHTRLEPSVSYAIGIQRKINQRLKLGIGFQYAMIKEKVDLTGQETRTTYHEIQRLVNGSGGPQLILDTIATTSHGLLTIDALNSYRLLSIPVSVQYNLLHNQGWSLQLDGGLVATIAGNYHNKIQGKLVSFDSQGMHTSRHKRSNAFDLFAGLRFSKNCSSFRLFAEPMLRYNLSGYDLDAMINRKSIHQAGLSVGITYLIGR
jgi:hypothetical protein